MTFGEQAHGPADGPFSETLYEELRALAAGAMRHERGDHTLQPTALVHEAWLRLGAQAGGAALDENAFRALAARTLRRVLIDHARARTSAKRGGQHRQVPLDPEQAAAQGPSGQGSSLLDLEDALALLGERSPRQAKVVELHFLGGLTLAETARALDVAHDTARREWRFARAWLNRALAGKDARAEEGP